MTFRNKVTNAGYAVASIGALAYAVHHHDMVGIAMGFMACVGTLFLMRIP